MIKYIILDSNIFRRLLENNVNVDAKLKQLKKSYVYDTLTALTLLLVAVIMFFGLFSNSLGVVGVITDVILLGGFGIGGVLIPLALIFTALILLMKKKKDQLMKIENAFSYLKLLFQKELFVQQILKKF